MCVCVLHSLHAGMLYRCCSSLKSLSHEFLTITVRACRVYFLTESSRSCQISNDLSSPSTVSFTSMLFNCAQVQKVRKKRVKKNKICLMTANIYLHHVLKDVGLCLSVAVSLGFADDAVVLKQEDVTVVTPGGCSYSRSPFPHLEGSLILER